MTTQTGRAQAAALYALLMSFPSFLAACAFSVAMFHLMAGIIFLGRLFTGVFLIFSAATLFLHKLLVRWGRQ